MVNTYLPQEVFTLEKKETASKRGFKSIFFEWTTCGSIYNIVYELCVIRKIIDLRWSKRDFPLPGVHIKKKKTRSKKNIPWPFDKQHLKI